MFYVFLLVYSNFFVILLPFIDTQLLNNFHITCRLTYKVDEPLFSVSICFILKKINKKNDVSKRIDNEFLYKNKPDYSRDDENQGKTNLN